MTCKIKEIFSFNLEPIIIKLYENLSEDDALNLEQKTIGLIGKKINDNGPLLNISDGGIGIHLTGYVHPMKGKKNIKISEYIKKMGKNHHFFDKDVQRKAAEGKKGKKRPQHSEKMKVKKNPFFGKHHTREFKEKISDKNSKIYEITYPNSTTIVIKNLHKYCKENNLNYGCMLNVVKKQRNHYKGIKCERSEFNK